MLKTQNQCVAVRVRREAQSGFTLIEVLISVTLFLIVTGAIYGLLEAARTSRFTTNQKVESMQNLRVALDVIGRDAQDAGRRMEKNGMILPNGVLAAQLGIPADGDNTRDLLYAIVPGNNINPNDFNLTANARTDQVSFAYRDPSFNLVPDSYPDQNMRRFDPDMRVAMSGANQQPSAVVQSPLTGLPAASLLSAGDLVVLDADATSVMASVTSFTAASNTAALAAGDRLGINRQWSQSPLNPAVNSSMTSLVAITRLTWVSYAVLRDGTLVRRVYGNNPDAAVDVQPLAFGVEDMQVQYVMRNGATRVMDDPSASPNNVCQVRVTITARSSQTDQRTNQPIRITMTAAFNTRNVTYEG